jgi:ribosomal silencing factor RsfS
MTNEQFIEKAKSEVSKYTIEHLDKSEQTPVFDVFVVWSCKTLQNSKALLSTTISDGMYYECTYNGDKNEMYFDAYKKFENKCISVESEV